MLPKKRKINSSTIKKVLHNGVSFSSPLFSLKVMKNTPDVGFSVSVSSRIAKTKVDRNKFKRRVYNALTTILKGVKSGKGFIFIKNDPTRISFKDMKQEIVNLFIKAGIR